MMSRTSSLKCLLAAVLLLACVELCNATTYVVVDSDGSVEDSAALITMLQQAHHHGTSVQLLSVSGATWGYGSSATYNYCQISRLSAYALGSSFATALGRPTSISDAYNQSTLMRGCHCSQGFPRTPQEAKERNMAYARADVSAAFGAAPRIPSNAGESKAVCSATPDAAMQELLHIIQGLRVGVDRIVYLQYGSATNLAAFLSFLKASASTAVVSRFVSSTEVHVVEMGYSAGADQVAMQQLLDATELELHLYPPSFFAPSSCLSATRWPTLFDASAALPLADWLQKSWTAKKKLVDARAGQDAFFRECGTPPSLVALCSTNPFFRTLCTPYRTAATGLHLSLHPPSTTTGPVHFRASGLNLTHPIYYMSSTANATGSHQYVYTTPADTVLPGMSGGSLVSNFWQKWPAMLQNLFP